MRKQSLPWGPVGVLLLLSLVWGGNMAAIKIGARDLTPVFMSALRSTLAAVLLGL